MSYQKLIAQLTMAIRANEDISRIFQLTLEGLAQSLIVDRAMIILLKYTDPLNRDLTHKRLPKIKASLGCEWRASQQSTLVVDETACESSKELSFWVSECNFSQLALREAPKPVAIAPVNRLNGITLYPPNPEAQAQAASIFRLQEFTTLVCVPLYAPNSNASSNGTVLGFLVLQHQQPRLWQVAELELIELISAQVSSAIIQTQTLRQVQGLVEERTAQLQRALDVQAKLYEQTRRQIDQLRHANQLKDEFLAAVQDKLKTPLATMRVAITMLREAELPPERREKYLDILEEKCNQEINLIQDLLTLRNLESKQTQLHCQPIDLKLLFPQLAIAFEEEWAPKGLSLQINLPMRPLKLRSDLESLTHILKELLVNAGKHSHPNTTVVLSASHQADPQQAAQIILTLSNIGTEITPAELPYIFDKFRRGEAAFQQRIAGTGLGLALVKSLVQHLEGTIAVSSQPLEQADGSQAWQTCFTVILPQLLES